MPTVKLPTFHQGQMRAFNQLLYEKVRFQALRCGRRFGKTDYGKILASDIVCKGGRVGVFVPNFRLQVEVFNDITTTLEPIKKSQSKSEWAFRGQTGCEIEVIDDYGSMSRKWESSAIEFWSLENPNAGRSRKYDLVLIDEAAHGKDDLMEVWERSIAATLVDRMGSAVVMSTPNGIAKTNFFFQICTQKKHGFTEFHAPTAANPYMHPPYVRADELERLKTRYHPLVYRQEILAEFVDWSGEALFSLDKLLSGGKPIDYPQHVEYVFATIDTAVKDGQENDGTGVIYWAYNLYGNGPKLSILDWDIIQIKGNLLEEWLPSVYETLVILSGQCKARYGIEQIWIEDKMSGSILIQQGQAMGLPVSPIDDKYTGIGKDQRAILASGPVWRGEVKISQWAFEKHKMYKEYDDNHLLSQVMGFTLYDKKAATRADDLLDCFTYGTCVAGVVLDDFKR
jgi:hypothetical protein